MEDFYRKTREVGLEIRSLCEKSMLFDMDHVIQENEIKYLTRVEAVMDLSYFFYEYYVLGKEERVENMNHMLDSMMITDDSDLTDILIYHHAYLFLEMMSNTSLYQDLIERMVYLGGFYEEYHTHKKQFEEFELMEYMEELNIK
jgi:hypothetical protein